MDTHSDDWNDTDDEMDMSEEKEPGDDGSRFAVIVEGGVRVVASFADFAEAKSYACEHAYDHHYGLFILDRSNGVEDHGEERSGDEEEES